METNAKLQEGNHCSNIDKATGNDTGALKNRIKTTNTTREGFLKKNIVAVSFFQDCAIHPNS